MFRTLLVSPFNCLIFAAVVLNRLAIVSSVSPFRTLYVVRNDGWELGAIELDGPTVGDGEAVAGGVPLGAAAMVEAMGPTDGVAPDPAVKRARATIAKATTMSPIRAI